MLRVAGGPVEERASFHHSRRARNDAGCSSIVALEHAARDAGKSRDQTLGRRFRPSRAAGTSSRPEERRVGKECRSRWSPYHLKKKHRKLDQSIENYQLAIAIAPNDARLYVALSGVFKSLVFFKQKTAYELST